MAQTVKEFMDTLNAKDVKIEMVEDRPKKGVWHNGPNPHWITITHLPTMSSVRAYGSRSQHHTKCRAMGALLILLEETPDKECRFPEAIEASLGLSSGSLDAEEDE